MQSSNNQSSHPPRRSDLNSITIGERKDVVVDCDAGTDDALALMILFHAHKCKRINLKAVTCVHGSTSVDNVVKNVCRTMKVCNITDVPVYKGAYCPLVDNVVENTETTAMSNTHGTDGFGDVYTDEQDISKMRKPHASYIFYKLAANDPGHLTVICLGPLTNVALAIRTYPDFLNHVKDLYVLGGNTSAQGNVTSQAEFNFFTDPESVHIVMKNFKKPFWLLPWESCLKSQVTHEWRNDIIGKVGKPITDMLNKIEEASNKLRKKRHFYMPCDAILAAIVLRPDMAKNIALWHADIELRGSKTRGQVVLDHLQNKKPNVNIIDDFDSGTFKLVMHFSLDPAAYQNDNNILYP